MKKRILIPCLLMATSLTACDSGLVTRGETYKEGETTKVQDSLKNKIRDSVKAVEIYSKTEFAFNTQSGDKKESTKSKASIEAKVDLKDKSIELSCKTDARQNKSVRSLKAKAKAKEEDGYMRTVYTDGDYSLLKSTIDFNALMTSARNDVFSWNFSLDYTELDSVLSQMGTTSTFFAFDIQKNTLINGNSANGTFNVGLSKEITGKFEKSGLSFDLTITKMKYVFKDCLLKSAIVEVEAYCEEEVMGEKVKMSYEITAEEKYSYTLK